MINIISSSAKSCLTLDYLAAGIIPMIKSKKKKNFSKKKKNLRENFGFRNEKSLLTVKASWL
jgi:hypothetical protein